MLKSTTDEPNKSVVKMWSWVGWDSIGLAVDRVNWIAAKPQKQKQQKTEKVDPSEKQICDQCDQKKIAKCL